MTLAMISPPPAAARLLRRFALVGLLAVTFGVASTVVEPPAVEAAQAALPTNAMAPVVTSSAREALASYDEYLATDDPAALRRYVWYRTQTARYAATELGYPQQAMVEAWAATPIGHQRAVLAAMTQVGVPYRRNTSSENIGFDCSGLTTFAWSKAGVQLVRQSGQQIRDASPLDRSSAKAGDLVQYPGHVMMYLGVGEAVVHSVMTGRTVELDTISERQVSRVRFGDPTV
ncbi:MAG TPA: NlpC/P60 family protein [Ilumatobacteraceae bacterium]|nr:NlpC/P60 family protein [Ilumatobacteraceae bacterium]